MDEARAWHHHPSQLTLSRRRISVANSVEEQEATSVSLGLTCNLGFADVLFMVSASSIPLIRWEVRRVSFCLKLQRGFVAAISQTGNPRHRCQKHSIHPHKHERKKSDILGRVPFICPTTIVLGGVWYVAILNQVPYHSVK